jgi:Pterin binding enzyme
MSGTPDAREPRAAGVARRPFAPGRLLVMAIVNRTPDSFYRPGATWDESAAIDRVHQVVAEGADILDVGSVGPPFNGTLVGGSGLGVGHPPHGQSEPAPVRTAYSMQGRSPDS